MNYVKARDGDDPGLPRGPSVSTGSSSEGGGRVRRGSESELGEAALLAVRTEEGPRARDPAPLEAGKGRKHLPTLETREAQPCWPGFSP